MALKGGILLKKINNGEGYPLRFALQEQRQAERDGQIELNELTL